MAKTLIYIMLLSLLAFGSQAQDGKFERQTIIYEDTLAMDLFLPKGGNSNLRPVLIYVHGGGFSGGERDSPNHIAFCEYFAKKGWVTATISYHLTMKGKSFSCDQQVKNKINTIYQAAQNVNQATAFILKDKNKFRINPNKIVIAGSSAGAEAVIHASYWNKTQENILPDGFKYGGVISMAGALLDENWITQETAIPTQLFHGICDNLVPYATAAHHYCNPRDPGFMMLFGSYAITKKLRSLNKAVFLVSDCGGGHEWAGKPIQRNYITMIEDFLINDVLKESQRQVHKVYHEGKSQCDRRFEFCTE